MIDIYSFHSAAYAPCSAEEDRDLSRAAAERYLMLQALSERTGAKQTTRARALLSWFRSRFSRRGSALGSRRAEPPQAEPVLTEAG